MWTRGSDNPRRTMDVHVVHELLKRIAWTCPLLILCMVPSTDIGVQEILST